MRVRIAGAHAHHPQLRSNGPLACDPEIVAEPGSATDPDRALRPAAIGVDVLETLPRHANQPAQMPALVHVRKAVDERADQRTEAAMAAKSLAHVVAPVVIVALVLCAELWSEQETTANRHAGAGRAAEQQVQRHAASVVPEVQVRAVAIVEARAVITKANAGTQVEAFVNVIRALHGGAQGRGAQIDGWRGRSRRLLG